MQCIAHLLALTTDHVPSIAKTALQLLSHIDDKYPTFIYPRIPEGIKHSYAFQLQTFGYARGICCNSCDVLMNDYSVYEERRFSDWRSIQSFQTEVQVHHIGITC
jgi:hypothetical protein